MGGRVTVVGQVADDCFRASMEIASNRKLPTTPRGFFGRFIGRRGIFDPMRERFGLQSPRHASVYNWEGTITDPTIFNNIEGYGSVPKRLERYRTFDTFTPIIYNQLLDAFFQNWKKSSSSQGWKAASPNQIINWDP
jgi:hypothetical protein